MSSARPLKPRLLLVLATLCWGLTFPVMKAAVMTVTRAAPQASSNFVTSFSLALRFGLAALLFLCWRNPVRHPPTRADWRHGLGLGLFGAAGLFLQMHALNYIPASTSAFLTQFYCLLIPIWVSWKRRAPLHFREWFSCGLVLAGVAWLSQVDWRHLTLGRGETETLLGSAVYTAQILWLERPAAAQSRPGPSTLIMFATIAALFCGLSLGQAGDCKRFAEVAVAPGFAGLMLILTFFSTLTAYGLMNYWQPSVSATEAGLIYCAEPVFATLLAIWLPPWLSRWAAIDYQPESLTVNLLIGGTAITAANILLQTRAEPPPR